jgi:integrase
MDGGIVTSDGRILGATRARSAQATVDVLQLMLKWATTVRRPDGRYLLDRNPLAGVKRVREQNRKQPVATWERYIATRDALRVMLNEASTESDRRRFKLMEFALYLAECTGRRLGSIRHLRWEDFRERDQSVFWRAEADKKGYCWVVPMGTAFFADVSSFRDTLAGSGIGQVFAAANSRDGLMDRHLFDKWLMKAEERAGLAKLEGGMWHPYRRKWAIERKHLPLRDVAAAGGWKDVATLLEVYQQADPESVLRVMEETRKIHDRHVA